MIALLMTMTFSLFSPAFSDGAPIPREHAYAKGGCGGKNVSPPLAWRDAPKGTRSFALTVLDPDAPAGAWTHWVAYDIPASTQSLPAGKNPTAEARNSFGETGYGGPCPPVGDSAHHYHFTLYALDVEHLRVGAHATLAEVQQAMKGHVLGEASLVGTYQRK